MTMTVIQSEHLELIRKAHPGIEIHSVALQQGQFNHVLIVNDQYVFRFPRSVTAERAMAREIVVLNAIHDRVSIRVPNPVHSHIDPETHVPVFTGYEMIPGEPLRGSRLAHVRDSRALDRLARQLATFLQELHGFPIERIRYDLPNGESYERWSCFYKQLREELFPYMRREAREHVAAHFDDYFNHPERYSFEPRLRHGDLGSGNILCDANHRVITGVIDFGSVGPGDPAQDVGSLLVSYGQPFVERMYAVYPRIATMFRRAAFYMGTYGLQEALNGLRDGDPIAFESGISRFR